ncbi:MAG: hypothetical protein KA775_12345 [Ottowia sp.]|nr:hypothetical protein [Ottowia sp.]
MTHRTDAEVVAAGRALHERFFAENPPPAKPEPIPLIDPATVAAQLVAQLQQQARQYEDPDHDQQ